jgi:hypothetical protein
LFLDFSNTPSNGRAFLLEKKSQKNTPIMISGNTRGKEIRGRQLFDGHKRPGITSQYNSDTL